MKRTWRNLAFSGMWFGITRADRFFSTLVSVLSLKFQGATIGRGFRTSGRCFFKLHKAGSIRIGDRVRFISDPRSNRVGLTNPVLLETLGDGQIEIGDFSGGSAVVLSSRSRVVVGRRVLMGGNVRIFDHDFHSLCAEVRRGPEDQRSVKTAPVFIGDDVLIGVGATILKGVTIGDRAVIGAGSVVTRDVPADQVWAGNPARGVSRKGNGDPSAG